MKRYFSLVMIGVMLIMGCGQKKQDVYYPLSHFTPMILDQVDKKVVYLDWGEPLVYAGKMVTNTELVKGQSNDVVYVLVQRDRTKERGLVKLDTVVHNPVAKATLLNTSQVYKTPNEISREFFTMTAPMIGYVVEVQEDWARVKWYMAAYKVFTGKPEWTTYEWIKLSSISTNAADADLLSIAYTSARRLGEWQNTWSTLDKTKKTKVSNDIEVELAYLQNIMKKYSGAASAIYVANIINALSTLIYPVPVEPSGATDQYDGEGSEEEY